MKSIVEQPGPLCTPDVSVKGERLEPLIGRHCRSSLQRLLRSYRNHVPVTMLMSESRFEPGYVIDSFLASLDKRATVIQIARSHDDPSALVREIVHSTGV
jgi:hypothetical protein